MKEKALMWWEQQTPHRKKYLADRHCWSLPEGLEDTSIEFIYKEEMYGY